MASKLRASKANQVKSSLKTSGRFCSDQSAIWNQVEKMAMQRNAVSVFIEIQPIAQQSAEHVLVPSIGRANLSIAIKIVNIRIVVGISNDQPGFDPQGEILVFENEVGE